MTTTNFINSITQDSSSVLTFIKAIPSGYYDGLEWFFHLIKLMAWDNVVYLYHNAHWALTAFYVMCFYKMIVIGTVFTSIWWDNLFVGDFKQFPKGTCIILEFLLITSLIALFYNLTFIPHASFWKGVQSVLTWVYVDGLKSAWATHWTLGLAYFFIVDWTFGAALPIQLTAMIHGFAPLAGFQNNIDTNALNNHNNFMQLVNIEKAIGRIGRK